ncbi:22017_t:CDS:2, partial [Gigaspora margarita]
MVNAQQWLEREYPKYRRKNVKELDLTKKGLEGHLDLNDFVNLEKLYCPSDRLEINCSNGKLTDLKLPVDVDSKLVKIDCSWNDISDLKIVNYPNLIELKCSWNRPLTKLVISNCPNLKKLYCNNCELTNLEIHNCPQIIEILCSSNNLISFNINSFCDNLKSIRCGFNKLTNFKFLTQLTNPEGLLWLELDENNLPVSDLSYFSQFRLTGLVILNISRNRFTGSLKYLKNMISLQRLDIDGTDIDSGLEYLPDSLQIIGSLNNVKGIGKLVLRLEDHKETIKDKGCHYNIVKWRETNKKMIQEKRSAATTDKPDEEYIVVTLSDMIRRLEPEYYYPEITVAVASNLAPSTPENLSNHQIQELKDLEGQVDSLKKELVKEKEEKIVLEKYAKQLMRVIKSKLTDDFQDWLDILVESHEGLVAEPDNLALSRQLERAKKNLSKKLTNEEIQSLFNKKTEI